MFRSTMKAFAALTALTLILGSGSEVSAATAGQARVRLVHACPGLGSVKAKVNGRYITRSLPYGQVTGYAVARPDLALVDLFDAATQEPLEFQFEVPVDAGYDYTALVIRDDLQPDPNPTLATPFLDDVNLALTAHPRGGVSRNSSSFYFIHAVPDAGPVDLYINNVLVPTGTIPFTDYRGPFNLGPGANTIEAWDPVNNISVYGPTSVNFRSGRITTIVITGTLDEFDEFPVVGNLYLD
ncbi:MAG: DUF4397 domain-containing protein [Candidatus Sumerlaeaceae bacterium]|nr:DUF4397 domain-containing protein [Candidatus Sumerlaeaceae bacterium]